MTAPASPDRPLRYRDANPRDRRRFRLVVVVMSILVVAGLVVVADFAARAWTEQRVAAEIEARFPESVTGAVDVKIGGLSMFVQYLTGRFEAVRLHSDDLRLSDVPVVVDVELTGVPVDTAQPVEAADGQLVLTEESVARLLEQRGVEGEIRFSDDTLTYRADAQVLGQSITVAFDATPSIDGGRLVFTPQNSTISGGGVSLPVDDLLPVVAPEGLAICVAEHLPEPVTIDSVALEDGIATVRFTAADLPLDATALNQTGSC